MAQRGTEGAGAASPLSALDARRDPSTHQLRLFLVVAEELHFGRSAARMFMTQPAFSQQIRALEKRLGLRLVDRNNRSVEVTAAGRALLPKARAVVEAMGELHRAADVQARRIEGRLVLGSIGAEAQRPYTRAILEELHAQHPQLTVEVRSLDFAGHVTALASGAVDAVLLLEPVPPEIETIALAGEPRVACLPSDDPLAGRARVTLAELGDRPVVDVPPECPRLWWDFWAVDPRPDGTKVRYGPVVSDLEALFLTVSRGQAMAFLPAAARDFYPRPGVSYVEVSDLGPCTAALGWPAANRSLPAITVLRRTAQAVRRRLPTAPRAAGRAAAGAASRADDAPGPPPEGGRPSPQAGRRES